jgi:NAD+ diphosphatase
MLGFHAEGLTEEIRIDPDELKDARWFSRDQLRNHEALGFSLPRADSIARRLIEDWLAS